VRGRGTDQESSLREDRLPQDAAENREVSEGLMTIG